MTQSTSNSSSAPTVNMEGILEQVLGTRRGHKTGVGHTLSQRIHGDTSSSSSCSDGTSARVDQHVKEYLHRSYEQNSQIYESHRMMQQLLAQLHPNIQFLTITHLESYNPPGSPPPPDVGDDNASDAANLGDSNFLISFTVFCIKLKLQCFILFY